MNIYQIDDVVDQMYQVRGTMSFPGNSDHKESAYNTGDPGATSGPGTDYIER